MARQDGHLVRCEAPLTTAVPMLRATVGPIAGVEVLLVGGWNGPRRGTLKLTGSQELQWRAPGSGTFGTAVDVSAGGTFWLADGAEPDKWIQVETVAAELPSTPQFGRVELAERWNNAVADVDTQPDDTDNWTLYLRNNGAGTVDNICAWLDAHEPANRRLTLQLGGGGSGQPYSEAEGLALWPGTNVLAGTALPLVVTRVIPAGVDASPRRLVRIHVSWDDGEGGRARTCLRGCYRIAKTALYQAYHTEDADPDPNRDTPFATNASLPWTPADVFGNGDHRFALTRINTVELQSDPDTIERVVVSAGAEQDLPPVAPYQLTVTPRPSSKVRVEAVAILPPIGDAKRPTHWALWYTTDGNTPGSGDPDYTEAIQARRGFGFLRYDGIPPQAGDTVVKVCVKTRGATVYSETSKIAQWTIKSAGPAAPAGGEVKK